MHEPIRDNLRRIRADRQVTIEGLSRTSGVSARTIKYIESGDANPRLSIIESLAAALNCTAAELLYEQAS